MAFSHVDLAAELKRNDDFIIFLKTFQIHKD